MSETDRMIQHDPALTKKECARVLFFPMSETERQIANDPALTDKERERVLRWRNDVKPDPRRNLVDVELPLIPAPVEPE